MTPDPIRGARPRVAWHFAYISAVVTGVLGLGIGALLGNPGIGAGAGLVIGGLLGAIAGWQLTNRMERDAASAPPPGGWRRWEDDDD